MNAIVAKPSKKARRAAAVRRQKAERLKAERQKEEAERLKAERQEQKAARLEAERQERERQERERPRLEAEARWLKEACAKEQVPEAEDLGKALGIDIKLYLNLRGQRFSHEKALNECRSDRRSQEFKKRARLEAEARWLKEARAKEQVPEAEDLGKALGIDIKLYLNLRGQRFSHEKALDKCFLAIMSNDRRKPPECVIEVELMGVDPRYYLANVKVGRRHEEIIINWFAKILEDMRVPVEEIREAVAAFKDCEDPHRRMHRYVLVRGSLLRRNNPSLADQLDMPLV